MYILSMINIPNIFLWNLITIAFCSSIVVCRMHENFMYFLSFFLSFNLFLSSLESFCCMAFLSSGRWAKEEEQRSFVIAHISFNFLAAALFGIEAKEKTFCICLYRSVLLLYCRPLTWFDLSFLDQQATTTLSPLFSFFSFSFPRHSLV